MAAPVISSLTTDKSAYNAGDTITVTVDYVAGASSTGGTTTTLTGTATDASTGQTGSLTVTFVLDGGLQDDPTDVTVHDSDGRVYTQMSDSGSVAIFQATA